MRYKIILSQESIIVCSATGNEANVTVDKIKDVMNNSKNFFIINNFPEI